MEPVAAPVGVKSVRIGGDNSGQIAVGSVVYQIGSISGGVVNFIVPEEQPVIEPRPTPVKIRPRRLASMLDRKTETQSALENIAGRVPMEIYGEDGIGKSTLLRGLAYHPTADTFPDGVIYLLGRDQPVEDLLQSLFDAFYQTSRPYKPSEAQVRLSLSGKHALILLDDLALDGNRVQALMDAAPECAFVLASHYRHVWGDAVACALSGLPEEEACQLFNRELGRELSESEAPFANQIAAVLMGNPLHLIQAAGLVREQRIPPGVLAKYLSSGDPVERLNNALLNSPREEKQKRLLMAMAAFGVPAPAGAMGTWSGMANPLPELAQLVQQGMAQASGTKYQLVDGVRVLIEQTWNLAPVRENLLLLLSRALETMTPGTAGAPLRWTLGCTCCARCLAAGAGRTSPAWRACSIRTWQSASAGAAGNRC